MRSKLEEIFPETPKPDAALLPQTNASLNKLEVDLTEKELAAKGYLPAVLPNPFGTRAAMLDEFKTFVQAADARLARLQVIVLKGLGPVLAQLTTATDTQSAAIWKAIKDIDGPSDETVSAAALLAEVKKIVATLQATLGEGHDAGARSASSELTYERITATLVTTSALAWAAISLLSIVSGYYVLVYSELGFGLGGDYLKCLLWGFGLPTAAQQVLTLAPATVRTSLVSSVPRNAATAA